MKALQLVKLLMVTAALHSATFALAESSVTIYFVRHGKTILNAKDRVQGWIDSPLTPDGVKTAQYLGLGLKGIPFDAYYSSDAGRQRETLQIVAKEMGVDNFNPREDKRLREVNFGSYEGDFNKNMAQASAKQLGFSSSTELFDKMNKGDIETRLVVDSIAEADPEKEAETYEAAKRRTQHALSDIVSTALLNNEKNILAISSGLSMQTMIDDLSDDNDKNKPLPNASVVKIIAKDGKYSVTEIGSTKYIEKGKALSQE